MLADLQKRMFLLARSVSGLSTYLRGAVRATYIALALFGQARAQEEGAGQEPGVGLTRAPPGVYFGGVSFHGTGCSGSNVKPLIRDDGTTVTLYFTKFSIALAADEFVQTANCWIDYDIKVPPGTTYTVTQFRYHVLSTIRAGVTGKLNVSYGFEGEGQPAGDTKPIPVSEPGQDDLITEVDHRITATEWAPCDAERKLSAKVTIVLLNGESPSHGSLEVTQSDGRIGSEGTRAVELKIKWAKCPTRSAAPAQ